MLRLVRDEDVELDESLDDAYLSNPEDMQEPSPQPDATETSESDPAPAAAAAESDEQRDGPVEAADEAEAGDNLETPVNTGALERFF